MTAAVATADPGAEVGQVTLLHAEEGTNRRARFALEYARGSGPAQLFAKAEAPAHREVHARNGNLFNESQLFASDVSLPLDHPRPYRVLIDRPGLDYCVVMEDLTLRGADPRDALRPLSVEQVANGLRGLARLHSLYWGFSTASHADLGWVQTWAPTEGFSSGLRRRAPTGLERGGADLPSEVHARGAGAIVDDWARFVSTLAAGPVTLLHGDAHIGNTYVLPDDDVGFLDWQVVRRGNWSQDVGYFLIGALSEEDRRVSGVELLDGYLAHLEVPAGQRPDAGEAQTRYRASAAYGLAIWLSTLGTDGFQSREVSLALAQRYAAACLELRTEEALVELNAS
jgi:aminoglycoside phosphotransferase (APT) family kinase protein